MRKRKTIRFLGGLATVALIVIAGIAALKLLIIPNIIKKTLHSKFAEVWNGEISIGEVRFNFLGPVFVAGIELRDSQQRLWCRADIIEAEYRGLKEFDPAVTAIAIDRLSVHLFVDGGNLFSPPKDNRQENKVKSQNLTSLSIRNIFVSLNEDESELVSIGNLSLKAQPAGDVYNIELFQPGAESAQPMQICGTINPDTGQVDLKMSADKFVRNEKLDIIRRIVDKNFDFVGQGHVTGDLTVSGNLKDRYSLWPQGSVRFNDWMVTAGQRLAVDKLNAMVTVAPLWIDVNGLSGEFFKGQLAANASAKFNRDALADIKGQIKLINGSLSDIDDLLGKKRFKAGQISARFDFAMNGLDANNVTGKGKIVLDNADIQAIGIVSEIFKQVGLRAVSPTSFSDFRARFDFSGPLVTIDRARIANQLTAVEVEKGGKVNLKTKNIDMYIVGIPLKKAESILKNIPVVNLFMSLKDTLVRLRVKGKWDDSPEKLMSKQPVQDIAEGTLDFFKEAGTKGINFGENVVEELKKLF
ncbi:MAG: AsmA-like C-terminal domain-containing protein [Phycisphaerae bacterium]|nr:AsmA-like C-terminal domain-containing protein [Phycisphaerae bacterium]